CLSDTTSFDVTFVSGTGIVNWNNSISIYPYPTSDVVTISKGNYTGVSKVNIYDLFGRKVFTSSDKEISLKSFADGVYVLEVKLADKTYTTRIIKE
ncbi:MAG: T9SS type A sorting domain-containing protein, partial [Methylophagaceae bacterium]